MPAILTHILLIIWPFSIGSDSKESIDEIFDLATVYYERQSLDSVTLLAKEALSDSRKINYTFGKGRSLFFLGAVAHKQSKPGIAVPYLLEALELLMTVSTNKSLYYRAEICVTLGKIFRQHSNISEALNFYDQGVDFAKKSNNKSALRSLLYNKSVAFRRSGDLINAINALTQSLDLIPQNNKVLKQRTYNQFGLIYRDLGKYSEARQWYKKMINLDDIFENSRYKGQACHNIATTFREQNLNSSASEYYEKALSAFDNYGNPKDFFLTYQDMAELALEQGENNLANSYAQKALALANQTPNTPDYYSIYKIISQSVAQEDPSRAFAYANQFMKASEAFTNKQKELLDNGDKYKVQLIASNYFNKVKRERERLKIAWTTSCAVTFIFIAFVLCLRLYRIYNYRSPQLAISHLKNPNEMMYLLDLFRNENEEIKNTLKQGK